MRLVAVLLLLIALPVARATFSTLGPQDRARAAAWEKSVRRNFDLVALHDFLATSIARQERIDGFDLARARIAEGWTVHRFQQRLACGDWWCVMSTDFRTFEFRAAAGDREVVFRCRRLGRNRFRVLTTGSTPAAITVARRRPSRPASGAAPGQATAAGFTTSASISVQ